MCSNRSSESHNRYCSVTGKRTWCRESMRSRRIRSVYSQHELEQHLLVVFRLDDRQALFQSIYDDVYKLIPLEQDRTIQQSPYNKTEDRRNHLSLVLVDELQSINMDIIRNKEQFDVIQFGKLRHIVTIPTQEPQGKKYGGAYSNLTTSANAGMEGKLRMRLLSREVALKSSLQLIRVLRRKGANSDMRYCFNGVFLSIEIKAIQQRNTQ